MLFLLSSLLDKADGENQIGPCLDFDSVASYANMLDVFLVDWLVYGHENFFLHGLECGIRKKKNLLRFSWWHM